MRFAVCGSNPVLCTCSQIVSLYEHFFFFFLLEIPDRQNCCLELREHTIRFTTSVFRNLFHFWHEDRDCQTVNSCDDFLFSILVFIRCIVVALISNYTATVSRSRTWQVSSNPFQFSRMCLHKKNNFYVFFARRYEYKETSSARLVFLL